MPEIVENDVEASDKWSWIEILFSLWLCLLGPRSNDKYRFSNDQQRVLLWCKSPAACDYLREFRRNMHKLDKFLMDFFEQHNAGAELTKLCSIILCLSHEQSAVQRGFSANSDFMVENLSQQSLISQRLIKDHQVTNCDNDPTKCVMPKELVISAKNGYQRNKAALADRNKSLEL